MVKSYSYSYFTGASGSTAKTATGSLHFTLYVINLYEPIKWSNVTLHYELYIFVFIFRKTLRKILVRIQMDMHHMEFATRSTYKILSNRTILLSFNHIRKNHFDLTYVISGFFYEI